MVSPDFFLWLSLNTPLADPEVFRNHFQPLVPFLIADGFVDMAQDRFGQLHRVLQLGTILVRVRVLENLFQTRLAGPMRFLGHCVPAE